MSDFNTTYWASKSPEINAMFAAVQANPVNWNQICFAVASSLAAQGRTTAVDLVDIPIMGWLWDPLNTMQLRLNYGYAWVPSALTPPVEIAPGIVVAGQPSYNPNDPPPLSIKVSVTLTDYPAYTAAKK